MARSLPVDAGVFAAAVADWRVEDVAPSKIKKSTSKAVSSLDFVENPDTLATTAKMTKGRPELVVGFAAETDDVVENATVKLRKKGCDWIMANDVNPATGIMGGHENAVTLISDSGAESWPRMSKDAVAAKLARRISDALAGK